MQNWQTDGTVKGESLTTTLAEACHHFWLTISMSRRLGINPNDAINGNQMSRSDYCDMVTRCRDCAWAQKMRGLVNRAPRCHQCGARSLRQQIPLGAPLCQLDTASAVHFHADAGDHAGLVRAQETRGISKILRCREAADWNGRQELLAHFGRVFTHEALQ